MLKSPAHGLHRALTWRYMLVTVSALLVIELGLVLLITRLAPPYAFAMQPDIYLMERLTATTAVYLQTNDREGLNRWLQTMREPVVNMSMADGWLRVSLAQFPQRREQVLLVFHQGEGVLAVTPSQSPFGRIQRIADLPGPLGDDLFQSVPPRPGANGVRVYSGSQSVAVSPIQQEDGTLLGLLVLVNLATDTPPSLAEVAAFAGVSILVVTAAVGALGALFGFLASRFVVRRVERLAQTTAAWGVGDFAQPVAAGPGGDEIDDLARHLNQLRTQIQALLAERERWAVQAERDRMARELHDSVKQQLFTIRMHLATAQTLGRQGSPEAAHYVQSAAVVTQHAQAELAAIIPVFHQAAGSRLSLPRRVRELVAEWSRQSGLQAVVQVDEGVQLTVAAEHALTRVLQETLANIYKHSGGRGATVRLAHDGAVVRLEVADDGRGFDVASAPPGLGLISMHERVTGLGGRLELHSGSAGTRVIAELPAGGRVE